MVNVSWLPPILTEASDRLAKAINLSELTAGSTVWLAVTGLSRAGKTVFITSLIHNLLSALHNPSRMPLLRAVGDGRLVAARLEGAKANRLPRFPYATNIEAMASGAPDWPNRTDDISEIGVDVRFMQGGTIGKLIDQISGSPATLSIRIVDYPGEWLLDLPLLGQSYAEWSRSTLRRYRRGARAEAARAFLAFISDHPYSDPASSNLIDPERQATAVDEPTSLASLGAALLVLGFVRMRAMRKAGAGSLPAGFLFCSLPKTLSFVNTYRLNAALFPRSQVSPQMIDVTRDWPEFQLEARDTEVAISFWNEKAKRFGKPPPLGEFDLSTFANWPFRFTICADTLVPDGSVFLSFGPGFAKLLDLPQRPVMHAPMLTYIPDRYRFLFTEGCRETIAEAAPVRFSGELAGAVATPATAPVSCESAW